jgi:hypothetical protein
MSDNFAKKAIGGVLEHAFGPNEASYLTTSYPHPIEDAPLEDDRLLTR